MDFVVDVHTHTIASGHAYSTVAEYAAEAKRVGLALVAVTDHAPAMPGAMGGSYFSNFQAVPKVIDGVRIMMGAELNILDRSGAIDLGERLLKGLQPVIASIHPPCYKFSREEMTSDEKREEITEAIINVMENPYIQILGHPGDPRYPFYIDKVVDKSLETGTLLEINEQSFVPSNFRFGSQDIIVEILAECKRKNCPVILGTDAHYATLTGKFDRTVSVLESVDFPMELIANTDVDKFFRLLGGGKV